MAFWTTCLEFSFFPLSFGNSRGCQKPAWIELLPCVKLLDRRRKYDGSRSRRDTHEGCNVEEGGSAPISGLTEHLFRHQRSQVVLDALWVLSLFSCTSFGTIVGETSTSCNHKLYSVVQLEWSSKEKSDLKEEMYCKKPFHPQVIVTCDFIKMSQWHQTT